jgi:hypothetical protein
MPWANETFSGLLCSRLRDRPQRRGARQWRGTVIEGTAVRGRGKGTAGWMRGALARPLVGFIGAQREWSGRWSSSLSH